MKISVYTRVAVMTLTEKRLDFTLQHADPFDPRGNVALSVLNPFGRVPVLTHDGFSIYETAAIERYLETAFPDTPLTPDCPKTAAQMVQVISIIDTYGYWPMVRQVFSHGVLRPFLGQTSDKQAVQAGLSAAANVLSALEDIAAQKRVLGGQVLSLADIHLAPMVAYFTMALEGQEMFAKHRKLSDWWAWMSARDSFAATRPPVNELPQEN